MQFVANLFNSYLLLLFSAGGEGGYVHVPHGVVVGRTTGSGCIYFSKFTVLHIVYTAPKVNPYLRIQTEPVLDGVDPMVLNVWYCMCMCCIRANCVLCR